MNIIKSILPQRRIKTSDNVRSPELATRSTLSYSPISLNFEDVDDLSLLKWTYNANIIIWRCVNINADKIASLPIRVGVDPSKPNDYNINHPLAKLLSPPPHSPNPVTSVSDLISFSVAQKLIFGAFAWEIELDGRGKPAAFWQLLAQNISPVTWELAGIREPQPYYFHQYNYSSTNGLKVLPREKVFYDWKRSQQNYLMPESALQAAKLESEVVVLQSMYDRSFLKNGGVPAHVVVTKAWGDEITKQRFRSQFQGEYGGAQNAGKTAFAEIEGRDSVSESFSIHPIGFAQKDTQALEGTKAREEKLAAAFGVPYGKISATGRTYENADAEDKTWEEDTIITHCDSLADAINTYLAPLFGSEVVWFDYSSLKCRRKTFDPLAYYEKGVISRDESRSQIGLAPIDNKDLFVYEVNKTLPSEKDLQKTVEVPVKREKAEPVLFRKEENKYEKRTQQWNRFDASLKGLETSFERQMKALFKKQKDATIARLTGKRGRQALRADDGSEEPPVTNAIFDVAFWEQYTKAEVVALYYSVVNVAGTSLMASLDVSFDTSSPYVDSFVNERANQLAGQVTDTTYKAIKEEMKAAISLGESIPKIAARIESVFEGADRQRATLIARTEVISAHNSGQQLFASQLGKDVVAGKEWIATRDKRVRDSHRKTDGQIVGIDEMFDVRGKQMKNPGDPAGGASEICNCRCAIAFLTPEEFATETKSYSAVDDVINEAMEIIGLI